MSHLASSSGMFVEGEDAFPWGATSSGRDVPRPLPGAERPLTGEQRQFLALQLEQDPDLLMKGLPGLLREC